MFLGWIRVGTIPDVTTGLEMVTPLFTELVNTSDPIATFDRGSPDIFLPSVSADLPRGE